MHLPSNAAGVSPRAARLGDTPDRTRTAPPEMDFAINCTKPRSSTGEMHYLLMKLADMYFWQIGYEAAARKLGREPDVTG